jgi:hypothetical protein
MARLDRPGAGLATLFVGAGSGEHADDGCGKRRERKRQRADYYRPSLKFDRLIGSEIGKAVDRFHGSNFHYNGQPSARNSENRKTFLDTSSSGALFAGQKPLAAHRNPAETILRDRPGE